MILEICMSIRFCSYTFIHMSLNTSPPLSLHCRSPSGMEVVASPAPSPEVQTTLFAHSLLFMVLHRCNDAAPTVRIRAIGALSGLLGQLKERGHNCPQGMCVSMLHLALGMEEKNKDTEDVSDVETPLNLFDMLRIRIDDSKPLVRAKAIQTFGAALALNWPKVRYIYANIKIYSYVFMHVEYIYIKILTYLYL
jgi:hypothetical protein